MGCRECCCSVNMKIAIAAIGLGVGILAGVWFIGDYHNYNAGIFGFVSAIFALITLVVHIQYKRHRLDGWTKALVVFMILGCMAQVAAIVAFVTYIALGVIEHQDLNHLRGENYYIALVWAWMTWKWGFALFWFSRKYRLEIMRERECECEAAVEEVKIGRAPPDVMVSADGESRE